MQPGPVVAALISCGGCWPAALLSSASGAANAWWPSGGPHPSDGFSRAVLWDIVVAGDLQGRGFGRRVVEELLHTPSVAGVERVYLMTTSSAGFYRQLGFRDADPQQLLVLKR